MLENNSVNAMLNNTDKIYQNINLRSPLSPASRQFYDDLNISTPQATPVKQFKNDSSINYAPSADSKVLSCSEAESSGGPSQGSLHTFFKMPKLEHVDASIHKACEFIMNSDLSLTPLNLEYLGHCAPSKEQRRELREKLGARFGPFQETEVAEIKQRFYSLLASINMSKSDAVMFCTNLENQVKDERRDEARHKRKWRKAGVRLIIGSYLGQDLHVRLAYSCFNCLVQTFLYDHQSPVVIKQELTSPKPANSKETPQTTVSHHPSPIAVKQEEPVKRKSEPVKRKSEPVKRKSKPVKWKSEAASGNPKKRKRKLVSSDDLNNMLVKTPSWEQRVDGSDTLSTPDSVSNPHIPLPAMCPKDKEHKAPGKSVEERLKDRREVNRYQTLCHSIFESEDILPDGDLQDVKPLMTSPAQIKKSRRSVAGYEQHCTRSSLETTVREVEEGRADKTLFVDTNNRLSIFDVYKMPPKTDVPDNVFAVCEFIHSLDIEVSPLNRAYRGGAVPKTKTIRNELQENYGARFRKHTDLEDSNILKRFAILKKKNLVWNPQEFCQQILELSTNGTKGWGHLRRIKACRFRMIELRNIIGLFVGQDMPNMIAYYHYDRLLTLVIGFSPRLWRRGNTLFVMKEKTKPKKWSLDEDIELLRHVVSTQCDIKHVEDVEDFQVDWERVAKSEMFQERGSSDMNLLVHWQRKLYPALVEESSLEAMLEWRKDFLLTIIEQGADVPKDVNWDKMEEKYHPKRKAGMKEVLDMMLRTANNRERIASRDQFLENINKACLKIEGDLHLSPEKLEKKYRWKTRSIYKEQLHDALEEFIDQNNGNTNKVEEVVTDIDPRELLSINQEEDE